MPISGPSPEARAIERHDFLKRLLARSGSFGITRLADITGLDRLGMPVWQAVRPAGRGLSVHQGKGAAPIDAKIGALCEAMESHCAENAPADGPRCSFKALGKGERAPELGDYGCVRANPPRADRVVQWCDATDILSGKPCYLPHDLVSLDFTGPDGSWFERSSAGLAAGTVEEEALGSALSEALERDAVGIWDRSSAFERMHSTLDPDTVPIDWFQEWRERLGGLGIRVKLFALDSVEGLPVIVCVIVGDREFDAGQTVFSGSSAQGDPERALFKAFAEALQSRLTFIAAARDDILPSRYRDGDGATTWAGALPPPPGFQRRCWSEIDPAPSRADDIVERLARLGYRQVVVKRLDDGEIPVVKTFVPGLGSLTRTRRCAQ